MLERYKREPQAVEEQGSVMILQSQGPILYYQWHDLLE